MTLRATRSNSAQCIYFLFAAQVSMLFLLEGRYVEFEILFVLATRGSRPSSTALVAPIFFRVLQQVHRWKSFLLGLLCARASLGF